MEKKIYIQPIVQVVKVQASQQFLTISSVGFGDSVTNANVAESKEEEDWDLWDEE